MRQIVKTLPPQAVITVDQLRMTNSTPLIAAYKSYNSDTYCVLGMIATLNYRAGFIPLNGVAKPRYVAENAYEAIEKASQNRKVYLFDSTAELIEAMYLKTF